MAEPEHAADGRFTTPRPVLWLCTLAIILCMTLSAPVLLSLGVAYSTPGGNILMKIHPASWVILGAFGLFAAYRAPHVFALERWLRERLWLFVAAASVVIVFVYRVALDGISNNASLIESYLMPSLLMLMLVDAPAEYRRRLTNFIVVLIVANALVGIGEAALQERLFTFTLRGKLVEDHDYFRATAFGGHPLRNALLTACGIIALVTLRWPLPVRLGCALVLGLGMLAFGGRAATAIGLAGALLLVTVRLHHAIRRGPAALGFVTWAGMIFLTVSVASAAAVLTQTDLGARIANGGVGDSSMMARADLTELMHRVDFDQLLPGYSYRRMDQITAASHLPDIESFWISTLLRLGLVGFLIWLIGFFGEIGFLWRRIDAAGRTIIVCTLLIASTSVSFTAKDTLLDVIFALALGTGLAPAIRAAAAEPVAR
jgi:hypothetical protein